MVATAHPLTQQPIAPQLSRSHTLHRGVISHNDRRVPEFRLGYVLANILRNRKTQTLIGQTGARDCVDTKIDSSVTFQQETNHMSFAITYTVKNEARTVGDAIIVHRRLGCEQFFVFIDGSEDSTREQLLGQPDVTVLDTVRPGSDEVLPPWIEKIVGRFEESMDVRKRINTWRAAEMARRAGLDWLIAIDVDEVVVADASGGSLSEALSSVASDVDQVLFPNMEVIAEHADAERPFLELQFFLRRLPLTHTFWRASHAALRKLGLSPRALAWYTHGVYQLRTLGTLPRLYRHPVTRARIPAGYFLGYTNHKSAVRTDRSSDLAFNIHRWQHGSRTPRDATLGATLHYDLPSADALISKFSQRSTSMRVAAFFVRDQLAGIASETSEELAREFFASNIVVSPGRLRWLKRFGFAQHVSAIRDVMIDDGVS